MSSAELLIQGGRPYGEEIVDIRVANGFIIDMGAHLDVGSAQVIDARDRVVLPSLVDLHTHLREPGREDSETITTGSRAAALGGFSAVFAMANTTPVADTAGVVEQVWRLGREAGYVDVFPIGAVTVGIAGQKIAELGAMASSAAAVRVFSDDGNCVSDALVMRRALEYVKSFNGVIAQHAQEPRLTEGAQMNEGELSSRLGLVGWPAVAEEAIIARDVLLASHVQSRLHICHLSTAGSVAIIRWAKEMGVNVTAEVTPHHLLLTEDLASDYNPLFKVNPPLRTRADVMALRAALDDGTIDIVATDHAPHPQESKDCEWDSAAFGMLGLETALSVVVSAMKDVDSWSWRKLAQRMSVKPAEIGQAHGHGRELAVGEPANIIVVDDTAERIIEPNTLASISKNTPYRRMTLPAIVTDVLFKGSHLVRDSKLHTSAPNPHALVHNTEVNDHSG